jgi:hypothetical protein
MLRVDRVLTSPLLAPPLQALTCLRQLELLLEHKAWVKSCTGLGQLTRLQQLSIKGRPLDEGEVQ